MDNIQILDAVSDVHFMPSWEFIGHDFGPEGVGIEVTWNTVNSDHDKAVQGYPQKVTLVRRLLVKPDDYRTREEFYGTLIMWLIDLQIHETREFFRTGWNMDAPFHPHRSEGEKSWEDLMISPDPMRNSMSLG